MTIGNFWVDLTRTVLYILLPLSFVLSLVLVSQGVVQTFGQSTRPLVPAHQLQQPDRCQWQPGQGCFRQTGYGHGPADPAVWRSARPLHRLPSNNLGTNGGGFFNANSAHPFENPTPLSNFLEMLSILLIPAALCYTFGKMVGDTRQGWAILVAMTIFFVLLLSVTVWAEGSGNPAVASLGVDVKRPISTRVAIWKARKCALVWSTRPCGPPPPPRLPTARSIRCTTRTCRWAA